MNNKKSIIVSVALAASMLATSMSAFAYTDISADHWAKSYIDNLSGKKYVSGYEDGTYKPDNYVTRAEFAKILTNIFGNIDKSGVTIADVSDSAWYADTMKIAVKAGYVTGYSDGTVQPEANITRQEAAVMVYRAWGLSPEGELNFTDKNEIADWASNQVATLAAKNVLNGYEDGTFKPNNNITRAEVAKIINCAIALGLNKQNTVAPIVPSSSSTGSVLHIGGTSSSTSHVSSGSSGGGSSSSSSSSKKEVSAGSDVTVQDDIAKIVKKEVDDDDTFVLEFNTSATVADEIEVSFTLDGKRQTMTIAEFNKEEFEFTPEEFEDANIVINIPKDFSSSSVNITADVIVDDEVVGTSATKKISVSDDNVNHVILALKAYQEGEAEVDDLAVIVKNAKKGYKANEDKCDKWIDENSSKIDLYDAILADLMETSLGEATITDSNYDDFQNYFEEMIEIVDNAAAKAVELGKDLSFEAALDYFNEEVAAAIEKEVDDEYADEVVDVAKAFGLSLASKIEEVKAAIAEAETEDAKIEAVFSVYTK